VRSSAPQLAPRTAHLVVKRVDHLADEAKARERAPEATYDTIAADIPGAVGKATVVEGDVAEARTTPAQTVAIVDDTRGCSHAPCLVRVTYGGDTHFKHGDVLRVYGTVARAVANNSSTVPEVEADFVQLGHAPR
jgi:RecJ-like exonuclease